jgi:hypothetical protein
MGDTCAYAPVSGPFSWIFQRSGKRHGREIMQLATGSTTHRQHPSTFFGYSKKKGDKINPSGETNYNFVWYGIGTISGNCDAKNKLNKVHTYLIQNYGTKNLTLAIHEEFRLKVNDVKILQPNISAALFYSA